MPPNRCAAAGLRRFLLLPVVLLAPLAAQQMQPSGVVFGAAVTLDPALGKLISVKWVADPADPARGNLQLQFDRGGLRTWSPVEFEDALAARNLVSGGPGLPAWKPGDAIGLVGLDLANAIDYTYCGADCTVNQTKRWNVVLQPALADTEVGFAAIMAGALPFAPEYLRPSAQGKLTGAALEQLLAWQQSNPGDFEIVDVPLRISPDTASGLTLLPAASAGADPVFLDVKRLGDPGKGRKFAGDFPAVAPGLLRISTHYARLNRFAAILGVMRLARSSGAAIDVAGGLSRSAPTPGSIAIPPTGAVSLPAFDSEESAVGPHRRELQSPAAVAEGLPG